jgi:flagellar capping protein FliD
LTVALNGLLTPNTGRLAQLDASYQSTENDLNKQVADLQTNMQAKQQALAAQFAAMEQAVSQLQTIGSFLQMQFNPTSQQQKL